MEAMEEKIMNLEAAAQEVIVEMGVMDQIIKVITQVVVIRKVLLMLLLDQAVAEEEVLEQQWLQEVVIVLKEEVAVAVE